ncbi:DUF222 domain-containing protein [Rhodococcus sp. NPDC127528]|uniref:HNH endonuclease signature motif containing protein n=1 Tax=unclassified Rhodococcus (in: high G+C Gram-positive bacteria) TaxID=192944 RepID=UPI003640087F
MHSTGGVRGVGQVADHLTDLDDAVDGLLDDGLSGLSDTEIVRSLQRLEMSLRKASAVGHRLIVEAVERSLPDKHDCSSITNFLIATLRLSVGDATRRVAAVKMAGTWHNAGGDELPPDLPATAAAQCDGTIGGDHVHEIRGVLRKIPHGVDPAEADVAEQILAELARHSTPRAVADAGQQLLGYLNPDGNLTDDRDRARQRCFRMGRQDADLMTPVSGLIDPETRALLEPLLAKLARPGMNNPDDPGSPSGDAESPSLDRDQLAKAAARDTRTAGQRNHDALKTGLRHLLGSGVLGSHRGLPVTAIVTFGLDQLESETGVATTASGGIVPIRDALAMFEGAHPVLVLFDHHGRPLHLGRTKRLASADQQLALIAASRGCTRPGCDAPATMTAVHHLTEWTKGGRTDITDLDLACDGCHALVHDGPGGWKTRTAPPESEHPGRTEWTPPAHIEPERQPRINHRHHLDELLAQALQRARARRETELRQHRARRNGHSGTAHGDKASGAGTADGGEVP